MPTLIDSLVVKLGLDSKDMESKIPGINKALKSVEDESNKTAASVGTVGKASKESSRGFEELTRAAASFLTVIGGTVAIKSLITDFVESNAALNRLSQNLGLSVTTISAWSQATEQLGGSAQGLQGTMDMLSRAQTELQLTGQSSLIPYFSQLGVAIGGVGLQARPVTDILLDLNKAFNDKIASGALSRTGANNMGRMMGIDQGTMNLILQSRKELELTIARQKETTAVTKAQAEEASKLQTNIAATKQQFEAFGRSLIMEAAPAIEAVLQGLVRFGNWIMSNREFVVDFLKVVGVGLGALAVAALPIDGVVIAVTALGAAIALLWQDYQTWKKGGDSFIDWAKWQGPLNAAINGVDKLRAGIHALNEAYARATGSKIDWSVKGMFDTITLSNAASRSSNKLSAQDIQKYFQGQGWSAAQAAGIAANLMTESAGRSNAVGDSGLAYGLAQWHPDRQAAFKRWTGKDIHASSAQDQLAFIQHELQSRGGSDLRAATTAADAAAIVSREYEGPRDVAGEAQRRGTLAQTLMGVPGASSTAASASSAAGGANVDKSVKVQIGEVKISTQATDAPGIAKSMGDAMNYLFTSQANTGLQ